MTRRELLKRTTNYIEEYTVIVGLQMALMILVYIEAGWNTPGVTTIYLIFIIGLIIINTIFGYYYVYDIFKKNIYEATIMPLEVLGGMKLSRESVRLARVLEGTVVGKTRKGFSIKRKEDRDYTFKAKIGILKQGAIWDKIKIKYLKHSRAIIEAEIVTRVSSPIFFHIANGEGFRTDKFLFQDTAELIREGEITHIYITPKEHLKKFFFGLIYAIISTTIIFAIQVVICFLLSRSG